MGNYRTVRIEGVAGEHRVIGHTAASIPDRNAGDAARASLDAAAARAAIADLLGALAASGTLDIDQLTQGLLGGRRGVTGNAGHLIPWGPAVSRGPFGLDSLGLVSGDGYDDEWGDNFWLKPEKPEKPQGPPALIKPGDQGHPDPGRALAPPTPTEEAYEKRRSQVRDDFREMRNSLPPGASIESYQGVNEAERMALEALDHFFHGYSEGEDYPWSSVMPSGPAGWEPAPDEPDDPTSGRTSPLAWALLPHWEQALERARHRKSLVGGPGGFLAPDWGPSSSAAGIAVSPVRTSFDPDPNAGGAAQIQRRLAPGVMVGPGGDPWRARRLGLSAASVARVVANGSMLRLPRK